MSTKPASASYSISAPMSFAGSAHRIWGITTRHSNPWLTAALGTLAVVMILTAWTSIFCWYLMFGLMVVPYRIMRRGQRKQRVAQRRHNELMNQLAKK